MTLNALTSPCRLSPLDSYHLAVELKRQGRFQEALNWLEIAVPTYSTSELHEFIGVPHWRLYELHAELFLFQGKFHTGQD